MAGVHAMWLTTQGVVRAAGGSIQTVFRSLVGTTLGLISVLKPLLVAKAVTTGDYASMAIGMMSIGMATAALIAAQSEQREVSDALRGANMALHGIQTFIGITGW